MPTTGVDDRSRGSAPTSAPSADKTVRPPLRLETDRLVLRPLRLEDAPEVKRLAGDWDVARFTASIPHPYEDGLAEKWIAEHHQSSEITLAIERRSDPAFVGCIGLIPNDAAREGVIGYWIGKPYWGQGYATEALRAIVDHAFRDLALDRVRASAMPENRASIRVQEKVGFAYAGVAREPAPARGEHIGVEVRALTRADWASPKPVLPLPVVLVAAVALIDPDGRVLVARRPEGKAMAGLWEFPGGKVRAGEAPEAALTRELKEELGIDVQAACLAPFTFASHRYETFHLLMPLYLCRRWEGMVAPQEGQAVKWVKPNKLADYPMPPADQPLVAMLRDFL